MRSYSKKLKQAYQYLGKVGYGGDSSRWTLPVFFSYTGLGLPVAEHTPEHLFYSLLTGKEISFRKR